MPQEKPVLFFWRQPPFIGLFLAASLIKLISDMHYRSRHRRCSVKKVFLENLENSQENSCATDSFLMSLWKNESLAQVFSCEFSKISKNTLFTEHLRTTTSGFRSKLNVKYINMSNTNELHGKISTKKLTGIFQISKQFQWCLLKLKNPINVKYLYEVTFFLCSI